MLSSLALFLHSAADMITIVNAYTMFARPVFDLRRWGWLLHHILIIRDINSVLGTYYHANEPDHRNESEYCDIS
jgi:hypothetical protein